MVCEKLNGIQLTFSWFQKWVFAIIRRLNIIFGEEITNLGNDQLLFDDEIRKAILFCQGNKSWTKFGMKVEKKATMPSVYSTSVLN
jgi:hypothetical protein